MTQKDKDLLLKDLCTRQAYGVILKTPQGDGYLNEVSLSIFGHDLGVNIKATERTRFKVEECKPYLRPMDSMTEEEIDILKSKCFHTETEEDWEQVRSDVWGIQILDKYDTRRWDNTIYVSTINMSAIDWLIANHFDYRGLIPKGLAIAVTKENNPYEE